MVLVRTNELDIAKHRLATTILAIEAKDYVKLRQIFTYLPPEDNAWLLTNISPDHRREIATLLGATIDTQILVHLDPKIRREILMNMRYDAGDPRCEIVQLDRDELIEQRVFQAIKSIMDDDHPRLRQIFDILQAADAAAVLEFLSPGQRNKAIPMLQGHFNPKILTFLDSVIRYEVMERVGFENLVHLLAELDYSEITEILEDVEPEKQKKVLDSISRLIDRDIFKAIKKSLFYDENTAGRIMGIGISFAASQTVKDIYSKFCINKKLPRESQLIFIYDSNSDVCKFKLIGQIYISELCRLNQSRSARSEPVYKYAHEIPCCIYTNTKLEEIGFLFKKYFVPEMPVINPKNFRLMGTIKANQAIDILDTSTEEELLSLAGLQEFDFHDSIGRTILTRLQWLSVASIATIASAAVIALFEETLQDNPSLSVIIPIPAGIGGNAAAQVLTVTVRAIANREIGKANLWRTIRKEVISNLGSGFAIGAGLGVMSLFYYQRASIGIILGASVMLNICWAGLVGSGLPILLDRLDKDPAMASIFLNIMTDIVGYVILLGLAKLVV